MGDSLTDVVVVDVSNVGIQGPPGPIGPQGNPGTGLVAPPTDGLIYGYQGSVPTWKQVLPLTGGTVTGPLNVTATGGTVSRSVQNRFGDVTNVRDFGAVGDGTTNDQPAIQLAANAIGAAGGALYFPEGNYSISAPIVVKSGTMIIGAGATITAGAQATWPGSAIVQGITGTSVSNVTIRDIAFVWPQGNASYGGGAAAHILEFTSSTHIQVLNCRADGGSNLTAFIGCTDVLTQGCCHTNFSNCAYDHWGSTTDARVIGCYCSSLASEVHGGMSGIQFTGMNTDGTAATTAGFVVTDNIVYINNANAQGISLNGHGTGGELSKGNVANNKVIVPPTTNAWGILVNGMAKNIFIHHNYIEGSNGLAAIGAYTPAMNVRVEHNQAYGWTTGAGRGIFENTSVGGTLLFNEAIACNQPVYLLSATDATTMIAGNDTGTGVLSIVATGLSFGSKTAAGVTDLSQHIAIYGTVNGFSQTSGRLNYVVGSGNSHVFNVNAVDKLTISSAGVTGSVLLTANAGLSLGNAVAPGGVTDLSRHLTLFSPGYGLSVTAGRLNYVVGAATAHVFNVNSIDVGSFTSTGLNSAVIGATTPAAGTFTSVTASSGTITALNVTTPLTVGLSASPNTTIIMNGSATGGGLKVLQIESAGANRWYFGTTNNETGSGNAGSDLFINAYSDAAGFLTQPLLITRATGAVTFAGPVRMNGTVGFNNTAPIAKPTVSGAKGSNAALASLMTALAAYGLVVDSTTA